MFWRLYKFSLELLISPLPELPRPLVPNCPSVKDLIIIIIIIIIIIKKKRKRAIAHN